MRQLIPNENRVFEYEKAFLEEKHRQGFKLVKRGWFFYSFVPTAPSDVIYEMDLFPKKTANEDLVVSGWELVVTQSAFYKKHRKAYYFSTALESRFIVDEAMRLAYYEHKMNRWINLSVVSLFYLLFSAFLGIYFSTLLLSISIFCSLIITSFLVICSIRIYIPFSRGILFLRKKISEEIVSPAYYIIRFMNPTAEQRKGLNGKLSTLGVITNQLQRRKDDYYSLESPILVLNDLKQEIMHITKFQEENLRIVRTTAFGNPFNE